MSDIDRIVAEQYREHQEEVLEMAKIGIELQTRLPHLIEKTIREMPEDELQRIRNEGDSL